MLARTLVDGELLLQGDVIEHEISSALEGRSHHGPQRTKERYHSGSVPAVETLSNCRGDEVVAGYRLAVAVRKRPMHNHLARNGREFMNYRTPGRLVAFWTAFAIHVASVVMGCGQEEVAAKPYARPSDATISLRHDIVFLTATELARKIKEGELTSVAVVKAYLSQIYAFNPKLNAVVTVDAKGALRRAKAADEALASGKIWGPLHGVPITVKDNYATKGVRTASGFPPLADYVPNFDATVVARLKAAGAIILGKTNLSQLAVDCSTNNPVFGPTNNPWDVKRTPGGSSGGAAAAVAAGMTAMGVGNDIGGSIRIPAHFSGVFGFKPTENMVSSAGVTPGYPSPGFRSLRHLVSFGPLARSIDDLKLAFSIIAGADHKDVTVPDIPISYPEPRPLSALRLAWTDGFPGAAVSKDIRRAMNSFVGRLEKAGCTVEKTGPSGIRPEVGRQTFGKMLDMEAFGVRLPSYARLLAYVFGSRDMMVFPFSYEKYLRLLTTRDRIVGKMEKFMSRWDAWICPVTSTVAYEHMKPKRYFGSYPIYKDPIFVDGKAVDYLKANVHHTGFFNLTGSPVVVIPIGQTKGGLPIGVQVVGKRWGDATLLTVAAQLFETAGSFRNPPGYGL